MRFQDWRGEIECTQIQKGKNNYNADGIIFDKDKDLELLLLESSGPLGTRDRHRRVFDHIKSAYGCYSMLVHILDKYPDADKSLIDVAKVLFVHSSVRVSYERIAKCSIPTKYDSCKLRNVIEFFWMVKELLHECVQGIEKLKESNDKNVWDTDYIRGTRLSSMLTASPYKPDKTISTTGLSDLDPVSISL
ncbi:hypothetical protein BDC45DRAFT_571185 [Circinella umbellata]|nr:hypothetical protein BDC45DRAFT_571185 [Circinella umbellata]